MPTTYDRALFSGRAENTRVFLEALLPWLPPDQAGGLDATEIGCGTGDLLFALADARPDLRLLGLDLSGPNIAAASSRARSRADADRFRFAVVDYLSRPADPADAIVTDGVLHLIPGEDRVLAGRLAADLREGGVLIAVLPDDRPANGLRIGLRRLWSLLPRSLDRLAVAVARRVYPAEPAAILEERVGYLRVIPPRLLGPDFRDELARAGFTPVAETGWPNTSAFKLEQRLVVLRRGPAPA